MIVFCCVLPASTKARNDDDDDAVHKLEGTRSRVRSHAGEWLRHLANINEARTKHPRNRRRLVTPPSECR